MSRLLSLRVAVPTPEEKRGWLRLHVGYWDSEDVEEAAFFPFPPLRRLPRRLFSTLFCFFHDKFAQPISKTVHPYLRLELTVHQPCADCHSLKDIYSPLALILRYNPLALILRTFWRKERALRHVRGFARIYDVRISPAPTNCPSVSEYIRGWARAKRQAGSWQRSITLGTEAGSLFGSLSFIT